MTIAAIAFIVIWAIYGGIGPWIVKSDRNQHTALFVYSNGDPYPLVQEIGEWKVSKMVSVAFGLIALALTYFYVGPYGSLLIVPMALALGDTLWRKSFLSDSSGHAAEIMAAEADGLTNYRNEEIERVRWNSNWVKALNLNSATDPEAKIAERLNKVRWLAKIVFYLGGGHKKR